jgi:Uma2 family endonuclease
MTDLLAAVMNDPNAPGIIEAAVAAMTDEQRRRAEFREWVTEEVKAEFINGEVLLHSPVKRRHLVASSHLYRLVSVYVDVHKLGATGHEKAMVSLSRNDYEPDICFWASAKADLFDDDTMLHPVPDFVVEILSKRTAKIDRTIKFQDYAQHGVREYWIIDAQKQIVEQYGLLIETDRAYIPYGKFSPGEDIVSIAIPGFTIPVAAIFDEQINLQTLQGFFK